MINYYKLERRTDIIASKLPQRAFDKKVEGLPVRFDVVSGADIVGASFATAGVVYNGEYIKIPSVIGSINVNQSDKYGVSFDSDGYVSLGIKHEN